MFCVELDLIFTRRAAFGFDLHRGFPEATFLEQDVLQCDGRYDRVIFNACFGNLFDPLAVLRHVAELLNEGGLVVISHPLGRKWLKGLQQKEPRMVLHDLPAGEELDQMLATVPLQLVSLEDEPEYYCLVLKRR